MYRFQSFFKIRNRIFYRETSKGRIRGGKLVFGGGRRAMHKSRFPILFVYYNGYTPVSGKRILLVPVKRKTTAENVFNTLFFFFLLRLIVVSTFKTTAIRTDYNRHTYSPLQYLQRARRRRRRQKKK